MIVDFIEESTPRGRGTKDVIHPQRLSLYLRTLHVINKSALNVEGK